MCDSLNLRHLSEHIVIGNNCFFVSFPLALLSLYVLLRFLATSRVSFTVIYVAFDYVTDFDTLEHWLLLQLPFLYRSYTCGYVCGALHGVYCMLADNAKEALQQWHMSGTSKVCA